jgi:hypothetical protein
MMLPPRLNQRRVRKRDPRIRHLSCPATSIVAHLLEPWFLESDIDSSRIRAHSKIIQVANE